MQRPHTAAQEEKGMCLSRSMRRSAVDLIFLAVIQFAAVPTSQGEWNPPYTLVTPVRMYTVRQFTHARQLICNIHAGIRCYTNNGNDMRRLPTNVTTTIECPSTHQAPFCLLPLLSCGLLPSVSVLLFPCKWSTPCSVPGRPATRH